MGIKDLASVLQMSPNSVRQYVTKYPERLPPRLNLPTKNVVWMTEDVLEWLRSRRSTET